MNVPLSTNTTTTFPPPIPRLQRKPIPGRNDPCPCGSGKKLKQCCRDKYMEPTLRDRVNAWYANMRPRLPTIPTLGGVEQEDTTPPRAFLTLANGQVMQVAVVQGADGKYVMDRSQFWEVGKELVSCLRLSTAPTIRPRKL